MNGRAMQKYLRYNQWWANIDKKIYHLATFLFLLLFTVHLINFILIQQNIKFLDSTVSRLEGVAVAESQTQINTGTVELTVISNSDYSKLQIYINGEFYKSFNRKSISLSVKNNDIIEINGIKNEYPAIIKITSVSDNIISLKPNSIIRVNKNFVQAGRIRLK